MRVSCSLSLIHRFVRQRTCCTGFDEPLRNCYWPFFSYSVTSPTATNATAARIYLQLAEFLLVVHGHIGHPITAFPDNLVVVLKQSKAINDLESAMELFEILSMKFTVAKKIRRIVEEIVNRCKLIVSATENFVIDSIYVSTNSDAHT
ncbi:hypothetical protein K469DRAFT_130081 [Zopfia rhizophila CBS 207.26]|uniref:Uncharacterized protein n=1 Tax=Zopfia rhizophila CBS 207.26 TaxID=1314779 RepID=A0A6A6EWU1_9PEZI|nr:hypothetical protein K469DRAFT_130081 [Zopfia rhizophila CBS 207.26]